MNILKQVAQWIINANKHENIRLVVNIRFTDGCHGRTRAQKSNIVTIQHCYTETRTSVLKDQGHSITLLQKGITLLVAATEFTLSIANKV